MTTFIIVALGVMVGTLMASAVALLLVTNPKVMKWYMNRVAKQTMDICNDITEQFEAELKES